MKSKAIQKALGTVVGLALAVTCMFPGTLVNAQDPEKPVSLTIGETTTEYDTVAEAVAAVPADGVKAVITLNDNFKGAGVKVQANQNIEFDLNTYTWEIDDTVGSAGTETNGMQLLQGATVTLKNGTLTSQTAKLLVQNYCDLTIDNMVMNGKDNLTQLIISNNNGSTLIKGGSEITAAAGGMAFDSDKWGSYDGGNVTLESSSVVGDINATNGGKIQLLGGNIVGNVIASNYTYGGFENQSATILLNGAIVNGDVTAKDKGSITVNGGAVTGTVDSTGENAVVINGGVFYGDLGTNVNTDSVEYAVKLVRNDQSQLMLGKTVFDMLMKALTANDSVELLTLPAGTEITVPENVTVKNSTGNEVKVNDAALEDGASVTIKPTEPEDGDDGNTDNTDDGTDTENPGTGDSFTYGSILLLVAAAGCAVALKRKSVVR